MTLLQCIPLLLICCPLLGALSASVEERLLKLEVRNEVLEIKVLDLEREVVHLKTVVHDQRLALKTNRQQKDGNNGLKTSPREAENEGSNNRLKTSPQSYNDLKEVSKVDMRLHEVNESQETFVRASGKQVPVPGIRQEPEVPNDIESVGMKRNIARTSSSCVAFLALLPSPQRHVFGVDQTVLFSTMITNVGNAYHSNLGVFIVPVDGLYVFSITLWSLYDIVDYFSLCVNGEPKVRTISISATTSGHVSSNSVTAALSLTHGDEVWVRSDKAQGHVWGNDYSSFTGFLIQPALN